MKFEVDTNHLKATAGELQRTLDSISKGADRLYGKLDELNGMWEGAAHDAYVARAGEDRRDMRRLIQEIQTIVTDVGAARESYDTCEDRVKDLVRSIQI